MAIIIPVLNLPVGGNGQPDKVVVQEEEVVPVLLLLILSSIGRSLKVNF